MPTVMKIFRCSNLILLVILFCFYFSSVFGNCLNYGHACWGGHGKRNGNAGDLIDRLLQKAMHYHNSDRFRSGRWDPNARKMYFEQDSPLETEYQNQNWLDQYGEK